MALWRSLKEVFTNVNNIGIICLSKTFLDSTIPFNDGTLYVKWHSIIRADHSSNTKRVGVCLYYEKFLPLKRIDISKLNECIVKPRLHLFMY